MSPGIVHLVLRFLVSQMERAALIERPTSRNLVNSLFSSFYPDGQARRGFPALFPRVGAWLKPGSFSVHGVGFTCLTADPTFVKGTRVVYFTLFIFYGLQCPCQWSVFLQSFPLL